MTRFHLPYNDVLNYKHNCYRAQQLLPETCQCSAVPLCIQTDCVKSDQSVCGWWRQTDPAALAAYQDRAETTPWHTTTIIIIILKTMFTLLSSWKFTKTQHPRSPFSITQPESWHSFYHPTVGTSRHCSKGMQRMPKAVCCSGFFNDKHTNVHGGILSCYLMHL